MSRPNMQGDVISKRAVRNDENRHIRVFLSQDEENLMIFELGWLKKNLDFLHDLFGYEKI